MIKKIKIIIIVIVILLAILGFLGYTFYADVTTLNNVKVRIDKIQLKELSLSYCKLKISFTIFNPSDRDISELSAVFDAYIANSYIGHSSFSKVSIPAQSNKEKDVTITVYYSDLAPAVVDVIKSGNFDLTAEGVANAYAFFGLITISDNFKAFQVYP